MEHKVRLIPFGVDQERFKPNAAPDRPALAGPAPFGLFVGRLVGYKGLDVLVDAVAGTDLRVVVVGEGPLRRGLEWEVIQRGLTRQIRVVGEVTGEELPSYYQSADYVVLPSTSPAEMFGITLIEAMACGKPIITTALPTGVREVNQPGVVGLEVPVGNPTALREAMQQLSADPEMRRRMGTAARARVEEKFTLKKMIDAHLALYRELAGK
jgi:rhamnosyl/mannosyltransferase